MAYTKFAMSIGMHTTNHKTTELLVASWHEYAFSTFLFTVSSSFLLCTLWLLRAMSRAPIKLWRLNTFVSGNIMFSMRQGLFLARLLCFIAVVLYKFAWTVLYFRFVVMYCMLGRKGKFSCYTFPMATYCYLLPSLPASPKLFATCDRIIFFVHMNYAYNLLLHFGLVWIKQFIVYLKLVRNFFYPLTLTPNIYSHFRTGNIMNMCWFLLCWLLQIPNVVFSLCKSRYA